MARTTKQKQLEPPRRLGDNPSAYTPGKGWRTLLEHLLAEATQRYGQPFANEYEFDTRNGWFYKSGKLKTSAIDDGDAFNLLGLMCAMGDEEKIICGHSPTGKFDELVTFWRKAANDFSDAVIAEDIRIWARNGDIGKPFRPVAADTWQKAIAAILDADGSYGPCDTPGWLASCIYWDKLFGVPETKLCSFFSERLKKSRRTISAEDMRTLIEAETRLAGKRLDVRTLQKIRAEKCSDVSQEKFLKIEEELYGPRERGRRKKTAK
jgi:hypothetical protein